MRFCQCIGARYEKCMLITAATEIVVKTRLIRLFFLYKLHLFLLKIQTLHSIRILFWFV